MTFDSTAVRQVQGTAYAGARFGAPLPPCVYALGCVRFTLAKPLPTRHPLFWILPPPGLLYPLLSVWLTTDCGVRCVVIFCPGPQVVIIAAPANAHPDLLRAVAPFVDDGVAIGALFAQVMDA